MNNFGYQWHAVYRKQAIDVSRQNRDCGRGAARGDHAGQTQDDRLDVKPASRKRQTTVTGCMRLRSGRQLPPPPGVPQIKRLRLQGCASLPDMALLEKHLAPYGLCRARVHESWSDFSEPPLPVIAEAPADWQARVGWAGRFEKVHASVVTDPAKPHHLGQGKSGKVVRMRERSTGRDVAVKKFQDREGFAGGAAHSVRNEFEVAHKLRHPRVVAPLEMAVDDARGKAYLVYPLVDGETLAACSPLPEPVARQVMRDIVEALAYLFDNNVNHNDLHGNNIIVRKGRGYLIDFGLASGGDEVLHRRDLRIFRDTMSHFWPLGRSSEAYKFFVWFKESVEKTEGRKLIKEVLEHPYMAIASTRARTGDLPKRTTAVQPAAPADEARAPQPIRNRGP